MDVIGMRLWRDKAMGHFVRELFLSFNIRWIELGGGCDDWISRQPQQSCTVHNSALSGNLKARISAVSHIEKDAPSFSAWVVP